MRVDGIFLDLDGTILRKHTVCQLIADHIGKSNRMNILEKNHSNENLIKNRFEIISWYKGYTEEYLLQGLESAILGPGVLDLINYCNRLEIPIIIVSMTWLFAVEHFAKLLNVSSFVGTDIDIKKQDISHIYPESKAEYVKIYCIEHYMNLSNCIAIGDSWGDYPMIEICGYGYLIGKKKRKEIPPNCFELDARKNLLKEVLKLQKHK